MNALTASGPHAMVQASTITFSPDQIDLIKRTICKGGSDDELALFMGQCQRTGLDPFAKQIYAVKRWNAKDQREDMSIQVGIDGFRLIADRHSDDNGARDYAGQVGPYWCGNDGVWKDVWVSANPPAAAKVGVLRVGFNEPLFGTATYRSYVQTGKDKQPTKFWQQMPDVMLAKVAEALALRKAFPNDLSGLYTSEEMGQAENEQAPTKLDPAKAVTQPTQAPKKDEPRRPKAEKYSGSIKFLERVEADPVTWYFATSTGAEVYTINADVAKKLQGAADAGSEIMATVEPVPVADGLMWMILGVTIISKSTAGSEEANP